MCFRSSAASGDFCFTVSGITITVDSVGTVTVVVRRAARVLRLGLNLLSPGSGDRDLRAA